MKQAEHLEMNDEDRLVEDAQEAPLREFLMYNTVEQTQVDIKLDP